MARQPGVQHRLDRRKAHLAARIVEVRDLMVEMLRPPNGPRAFMDQVTTERGTAFWKKYRYTELGKRILATQSPDQIATLDAWLARNVEMPVAQPQNQVTLGNR